MGNTLLLAGRTSEAIEQFQAAIRIDPTHVAAHDNLGLALAQTGHIPEAMEQYQKALQINPSDDKARANLAKLQQLPTQQNAPGKP
jgi:Flp pilus assembly protein TadD